MKTLYLMRHAKAGGGNGATNDFDRPLTSRGEKDASFIGDQLKSRNMDPQAIIASSAERTNSTALIIKSHLGAIAIHPSKTLYLASEYTILKIINSLEDTLNCIMLIGHNPGISDLIAELTGDHTINLSTSGFVELTFKVERWAAVFRGTATIKLTLTPH